MFTQRIFRNSTSLKKFKFNTQPAVNLETKATESTVKTATSTSTSSSSSKTGTDSVFGPRMITPNNFDKWLLVWMKRFPKGQVPDRVSHEVVYQTKNRARVKAANYMMGIVAAIFLVTIIQSRNKSHEKRAARFADEN